MSYNLQATCLKFSSLIVLLLLLQTVAAQKNKKNDKEYGIENFAALDALLIQNQKLLGTDVVALVARDTIVFKKEMGEFNSKTEAPIASASKWLTTALIMVLVDEGVISLDDKVSQYIPIFSSYGKNYITIRHCLSNFTGIESDGKLVDVKKYASLQLAAESFAKKEIQSNPGTECRYSNAGITIAGSIAEIVTKKKFDQLIKQKLFKPLDMTKTTFGTMDGSAINVAYGARSIANDYMKFLQMLLNNGKHNSKQVLSEEAVKEMRKVQVSAAQIKLAPKAAAGFGYAMGAWVIEEKDGEATSMTCPGFFGAWPVVDWERGYVYFILSKTLLKEQPAQLYMQMKGAVE
ncbi:MAG: serine hydrolase [Bacteroidota bacterium]